MKKLLFVIFLILLSGFALLYAVENEKKVVEKATIEGKVSYYGGKFHGRKTASGEIFDKNKVSAASNKFPLGTSLMVWRVNEKGDTLNVKVKVNDRMAKSTGNKRLLDLSRKAMEKLEGVKAGVIRVNVELLPFDEKNRL